MRYCLNHRRLRRVTRRKRATAQLPNSLVTTLAAGHSPSLGAQALCPPVCVHACATSHRRTAAGRSDRATRASLEHKLARPAPLDRAGVQALQYA